MSRRTRLARGGVLAVCLAAIAAAPAAAATTPIRTVHQLSPFTIPAGWACSFDVQGQPDWGFSAATTFPDGRVQHSVRAHGAYVNAETGTRYPTADNFRVLEVTDPVTGLVTVVANGQLTDSFLPGDDGPFGPITEASFYKFVGRVSFTYDPVLNRQIDFSYTGTVEDVCAALSQP